MKYHPKPINISGIELHSSLESLIEKLAEHVHDTWAKQRLKEGWIWGKQRNDQLKQHPNLVSYENLTEPEKDYDRNTASATLKAIIALGYRIQE